MAEFDLIAMIRARATMRGGVLLGIGDDAALLHVPAGHELVVTADTLNAGVHFPEDTAPADIGWKALAANLSDLASMGARPAWCTLSLSLPQADAGWLEGFLDGFLELAAMHGIALVGGDTTRGPLSIAVTAMGLVETGAALRRDRARIGDDIWVTGTLGDAAAALVLAGHMPAIEGVAPPEDARIAAALRMRLERPTPRVEAGRALLGLAHACVDVSDGLLADLGHVCERSGVGADIELAALPASTALRQAFGDGAGRIALQAGGGDDYELCFTAPPVVREAVAMVLEQAGVECSRIGRVVTGDGVRALAADGSRWQTPPGGYVHFG
ncbi:thiamine-phosphate kinase [Pseudoxanthomonas daejeonensis]|uniref:Thiamine-monophosphate kinase n=1 Tax=Pseudoxanthomonas daejeonensis TaxID=266062 RepID=A0ABQ6ZAK6_9GAMM|nr:thiamine-phosphate kinase [Pseudoxanthomonas daejeonensis]KAF1696896.1 thiamine-phosphate kinase [Pseudoxanthomonas daejeonensis]